MAMTEAMANAILNDPRHFGPQKVGLAKAFLRDLGKKRTGQVRQHRSSKSRRRG